MTDLPSGRGAGLAARLSPSLYEVAAGSLVAAFFLPLVALLGQNVRRILLAVVLLEMVLVIDVNLRFREETAQFGAIEGFNLSLTTLALVGLYTSWFVGFLAREPSSPRRFRMNGALALYLGLLVVSMIGAYDAELSQFELFMLAQVFLVHVYIASALRTRKDVLAVVGLLLIGLVLQALAILATVAMGHGFNFASINATIDGDRPGGMFNSPNGVAGYLALLLPLCVCLALADVSHNYKRLSIAAFGLGTIALIFTQSRGGWMAFALSLTLVGVAAWWRGYISLRGPLLVAAIVTLLAVPLGGVISERLHGDDHGSADSRIPLAVLAYRVINDYPWLGLGPNNFVVIEKSYVTSEFVGDWFYIVHNKYLLVWAENGLFALLAFLWFLGSTLRQGWRVWRLRDPLLAPLALGFTAAIAGHMWHMLFDVFHSRPEVQTLWVASALIVAMRHVKADV